MARSLDPAERETIITTSDADEVVTIWTAQRPYITALRRRAGVTETRKGLIGATEWAEFTVPRDKWTPLGIKRSLSLSDEERAARRKRLRGET